MNRGRSSRGPHQPLQFYRLADQYDALTAFKQTRHEVGVLEGLVRRNVRSKGRSWLDVGCGTGRHLEILRRRFRVTGVDASAPMLGIARQRLPGTRLICADMRSFRLGETFDVVSSLFSAIGHLRSEAEVGRTFRNFYRHLAPGGVCLIEPWLDPADFRPGYLHLVGRSGPDGAVARMSVSRRRGRRSIVHYEYLVGVPGGGVRHYADDDVGLLVARRRLLGLMEESGFRARFLRRGLTPGRGLLVGRKPVRGTDRVPVRTTPRR